MYFFNIIFHILLFITLITNDFNKKPKKQEKKNITILTGNTMGTYWQVKINNLKKKYLFNI